MPDRRRSKSELQTIGAMANRHDRLVFVLEQALHEATPRPYWLAETERELLKDLIARGHREVEGLRHILRDHGLIT